MKTYSKDTKGVTRLAFTRESQEGWAYICQVMEELGLTVYTDAYGAILGYMEGKRKEGVIIGSHYDTVIHGGAYDGIAGVAIGLDVAASYRKRQEIPPTRSTSWPPITKKASPSLTALCAARISVMSWTPRPTSIP